MMGGRPVLVSSAVLLTFVFCPLNAQLADNLIVSGSDKPMAYGVGTYGLKGAGTQGISGQSEAGGLYSAKIPTLTLSKSVPGVIVSDGKPSQTHVQFHLAALHHRSMCLLWCEAMKQDVPLGC